MDYATEAEGGEEAAELPTMDYATEPVGEEEAAELPTMDYATEPVGEEEPAELPTMDYATEPVEAPEAEAEAEPVLDAAAFGEADYGDRGAQEYVSGTEEMAEVEVGLSDIGGEADEAREEVIVEAVAEADEAREEAIEEAAAEADEAREEAIEEAAAEAAAAAPVAEGTASEDYVDLGAMIFGEEPEKSTRFVVDYQEPTGDEDADFARMLAQFKEKVSENLDADDLKAHHDLGTAYKEMGLLDEAVGEFQAALRASEDHLPTYELLGQTFMEMGQADAAARSLERAIAVPHEIEDELVGIYYYFARALEELGDKDRAVEYYDRVFALDINFADVTERLRTLRPS